MQSQIVDKNGEYDYLENPNEYKKARKRQQNRESAVRSRMRKKEYQDTLEATIAEKDDLITSLLNERDMWKHKYETAMKQLNQVKA